MFIAKTFIRKHRTCRCTYILDPLIPRVNCQNARRCFYTAGGSIQRGTTEQPFYPGIGVGATHAIPFIRQPPGSLVIPARGRRAPSKIISKRGPNSLVQIDRNERFLRKVESGYCHHCHRLSFIHVISVSEVKGFSFILIIILEEDFTREKIF